MQTGRFLFQRLLNSRPRLLSNHQPEQCCSTIRRVKPDWSRTGSVIAPVCIISFGLLATVHEVLEENPDKKLEKPAIETDKTSDHSTVGTNKSDALKKKSAVSRFSSFASIQVEGEECMTPKDFLDSVIQDRPRPRIKRKIFTSEDVARCLTKVRHLSSQDTTSDDLFRKLGDDGFITYTEYLFLLSLLTRPQHGFKIAFDVIDTSGDGQMVKEEFSRFCRMALGSRRKRVIPSAPDIFEQTTLVAFVFGSEGTGSLNFQEFSNFLKGFQKEVLMTEFVEYSQGLDHMSERDLAQFLLRFSNLSHEQLETYYDRLDALLLTKANRTGFSFEELELVTFLINNLDDFCVIAQIYKLAGKSLSIEEFRRASGICLDGKDLSPHLIETIVCLFDTDGNRHLNYEEFVSAVRNRKRRRKINSKTGNGWKDFKRCVRVTMAEDWKRRNSM